MGAIQMLLGAGAADPPTWDASGGSVATPGNGYKYHVFTGPGNFVVAVDGEDGKLEGLVIGAGGGGGRQHAGGGGAGSVVHFFIPAATDASGTSPISIGSGGAAQSPPWTPNVPGQPGSSGGASSLSWANASPYNITANGGGGASNDSGASAGGPGAVVIRYPV